MFRCTIFHSKALGKIQQDLVYRYRVVPGVIYSWLFMITVLQNPNTKVTHGSGESSRKNVSKSLKEVLLFIFFVLSSWLFMRTINFFMSEVDVKKGHSKSTELL